MSTLKSLDPRINRLNIPAEFGTSFSKTEKDQFITFEVFVQPKVDKPYQHEGIVHAPSEEMAFLFAKEQFSRRGISCSGVWVINTSNVKVSPFTENQEDIYDYIHQEIIEEANLNDKVSYEVFHLMKRGKQHKHEGQLEARSYEEALWNAKNEYAGEKPVMNLWIAKAEDFLKIEGEDFADIWETLPQKKYRDAIDYKATEKIKKFKAEQNS
jgi:ring-1,2-phenylacetyl-CoA epoxidase subunit PaaB